MDDLDAFVLGLCAGAVAMMVLVAFGERELHRQGWQRVRFTPLVVATPVDLAGEAGAWLQGEGHNG